MGGAGSGRVAVHDLDELAVTLDYAIPRTFDDGWTLTDIAAFLDVSMEVARNAVRRHRNYLSDDTAALLTHAAGSFAWRYWLSVDPAEIHEYGNRRVNDAETRLRTIHHIAARAVRHTDGRSVAGRKARLMELHVRHLVEQLDLFVDA